MDESQFLADYDPRAYEHPSVTVDVVLLAISDAGRLQTLLVRRQDHPFIGAWALPGGFVGISESLDDAAHRVLYQKADIRANFLEQLYTFGNVGRDPRTRVISVVYYALVPFGIVEMPIARARNAKLQIEIAAVDVPWSGQDGGPVNALREDDSIMTLAFDHATIIGTAVKRLRGKLRYAPIASRLLPDAFTLFQLQRIYEAVEGRKLNKDSFRRSMVTSGLIEPTGKMETAARHRPAALYHFTDKGELSRG